MYSRILILLAWLFTCAVSADAAAKPNVIVIFADDYGWHDLGVQGGTEVKTPHLDALARNGVRFTSGYVTAPLCSPSRAGLMSGRYQQRFGHETNPGHNLELAPEFGLPLTESTIANRLKPLHYATGWIGKSHLGAVTNLYHPMKRGFDEFFGFLEGEHDYTMLCAPGNRDPILRGYTNACPLTNYLTYVFAREITNYITRHKDESFFLYAPFNAVHTPHSAPAELLSRFPTNQYLDPNRRMMLAVLAGLDDAVGQIVAQLRALNLETNTLIFFTADNGGFPPDNYSINTPLRGMKTQCYEGGIRVPFLAQWPGVIPSNQVIHTPIITLDILPTAIAAAGGTVPAAWQLDGVNLLPLLTGQTTTLPRTNLFWRIETDGINNEEGSRDGTRAIRSGDWKLIKPGAELSWELYNLATNIEESINLADAHPEIVQRLIADYDAWAAQLLKPRWGYNKLLYKPLPFITEDIRIGATDHSYVSAEFLPGGTSVAFLDEANQLWRGEIDPLSGNFVSGIGRDLSVDTGLAPLASAVTAPQWGLSTNGPALFYTKFAPANHFQIWRARFPGNLPSVIQLPAATTDHQFAVRPSVTPASASVKLAFSAGTPANSVNEWLDENTSSGANLFPNHTGAPGTGNWLPNSADFAYAGFSPFSAFNQIIRYRTATQAAQLVTNEDSDKADVCGFLAPEFNNELCYAAVVDRTAIAIYRDLRNNTNGLYTRVATLTLPTRTTQRFLHSMQPLAGLRGFNGVSYFTCAAFENDNPQNPGDSGIWLFGVGPDTNAVIVRRLDLDFETGLRFAGRREPRTLLGEREVFCYYLSDDGAGLTQLRLAKTGLKKPDFRGPATGFTELGFSRSYTAGTNDVNLRVMGGTELMHLTAHEGRLYAGTGSRGQSVPTDTNNIPADWTGAQILVKDSPTDEWRVDNLMPPIFRVHTRVDALDTVTFTTRANGNPLLNPATLLVAGLSDISSNGANIASVRTRVPGSVDGWEHSTVATSAIPANVIAFGTHVDADTGVSSIFAGLENGEIYRGALNTNANGKISWNSGVPELSGGGPVTAFARCNGFLYAASGLRQNATNVPVTGGLFVRVDMNNTWRRIYRWSAPPEVFATPEKDRLALGLTTVLDPEGGTNRILLLARGWPGVIERIEPAEGRAVKVELDVRDFFARHWNDDRVRSREVTIGYTGFTAVTNPVTGEPVQLVGVWIGHPDTNAPSFGGTHFLIRHLDGTYEAADIPNSLAQTQLRATRCIAVSPFARDRNAAFYFGGYDAGTTPSTNSAWITRGDWFAWPGLTLTQPNPPDWQLAWPIAETNWLLEATTVLGPLSNWQSVAGVPTRSLTDQTLSVTSQTNASYFRLRRP